MIDKIGLALLTLFGIGHIKYAPGTVASFVTCLIYYPLILIKINFIYLLIIFLILLIYSIIIIDKLSHHFKEIDPKEIVIDEFIGMSIPSIIFLYSPGEIKFIHWLIAFLLFRFFDIFKPFPINLIDKKVKNGLGVVLDDVVAGIYTITILAAIFFVLAD